MFLLLSSCLILLQWSFITVVSNVGVMTSPGYLFKLSPAIILNQCVSFSVLLCHRPIGCTLIFILLVFGIILYRIFCWYLLAPQKLVEIILVFCKSLSTTHFSFFHIFAFKCLSVCLAGHDVCIGVGCYGFIQIIFNIHVLFNYVGTG